MTKEEKQRQIGFVTAYHIMKEAGNYEAGMKALEERMTRNEITKCPVTVQDKAARDFKYQVGHNAVLTMLTLSLFTLNEAFDASTDFMADYCKKFIDLFDTYYGGWLGSWDDISEVLKDEKSIDVAEWVKLADAILGKAEAVTDKREIFVGGHKKSEAID